MEHKLRILLAEDNPLNIKLALINIEKKLGHEVMVAQNGAEAYEMYKQNDFDYVLMDIEMPELNGFEATKLIRSWEERNGKRSKIIAMTAYGHELIDKYKEAGIDTYFCKPYNAKKLARALA